MTTPLLSCSSLGGRTQSWAPPWGCRLSKTPFNSSCLHFAGRSQLWVDIWSWSHLTSLGTAAATSKPVHSSPLLVLSRQLLQRSSDTDNTDVTTDTGMNSHTHSPHKSQSGVDLTHGWTRGAATKLLAWQFCFFGN